MTSLDWTEEMKLELLRLKADLGTQKPKILSRGIGIGALVPLNLENPIYEEMTQSNLPRSDQMQKSPSWDKRSTMPLHPSRRHENEEKAERKIKKQPKRRKSTFTFIKAHFADLLFIVMSLFFSLLSFGLISDFNTIASGAWQSWLPSRLLVSANPLSIVAILYGLYGLYFIFFKIILGKTLGDTLTTSPKRP